MGRASAPTDTYRDDPDAVSLHTTPDDYNYDDAPEISGLPPSYADSEVEAVSTTAPLIRHVPPSGRMDHNSSYSLKFGKPQVNETQIVMDTRYDTDPEYLEDGVLSLAKEAPFPLVYIMGTHRETVRRGDKKEKKEIIDFRIVMDMQRCLKRAFNDNDWSMMKLSTVDNGVKTYRGTTTKQRAPGVTQDIEVGTKPELKEWCHRFCASSSMLKVFRLRREVTGFDETQLKNQIEGLIRSTNYRGKIIISFPIENKNVDIYSTNRINEWRLKTWVRWVFYLSFLWIFTWPYLFFATKRYSVVKAEWPFSMTDSNGNKVYTTVSEQQWYEKWHVGIRRLVLDRYQGEASEDMLRGVIARPEDPPMPGTIRTGLQGVDNAVGLLTQGFQVARALQTGDNLSRGLQGGWGYDS